MPLNRLTQMISGTLWALGTFLILSPTISRAEAVPEVALTLEHHQFSPNTLPVEPDKRFIIVLSNKDNHPEEFESYDLEFEILVFPHKSIRVPVRGLPAGTYTFFGDFHPKTAQGKVVVSPITH